MSDIYLKYIESNAEILDQTSVPLVRLLHQRQQHVLLTLFPRTFTEYFLNLDPVLRISPETVWKAKITDLKKL